MVPRINPFRAYISPVFGTSNIEFEWLVLKTGPPSEQGQSRAPRGKPTQALLKLHNDTYLVASPK